MAGIIKSGIRGYSWWEAIPHAGCCTQVEAPTSPSWKLGEWLHQGTWATSCRSKIACSSCVRSRLWSPPTRESWPSRAQGIGGSWGLGWPSRRSIAWLGHRPKDGPVSENWWEREAWRAHNIFGEGTLKWWGEETSCYRVGVAKVGKRWQRQRSRSKGPHGPCSARVWKSCFGWPHTY